MSLSFAYSPFLLLLALAAAAGASYWSYRRTVPMLSGGRRGVLMTLRFAALALLVLLLFEPVVRNIQQIAQPPVVAVLVDGSQSMALQAGEGGEADTSAAAAREALRRVLPTQLPGQTRYYGFSTDVQTLDAGRPLDSLDFTGPRTDIAQALERVSQDLREENFGAVVLVSDGQYNAGRNPLYVADRFPVPIYPVVVGDTTRQRDVLIRRVTTNEIAYLGTDLPVQVSVRAEQYAGERVRVDLVRDGAVVDAQTIDLPEGASGEATADLTFKPEEQGLQQLRVQVSELPGEVTARNNAASVSVQVLESKKRLLLLAAAPGPDVSAVRQVLVRDPNIEVTSRVQRAPGSFYGGVLPDDLDAYDGLVLVGYPGSAAQPAEVERVAAAARADVPILFTLTPRTDLGALSRYFSDALPVAPERLRPGFVEAVPVLTPRGQQHPVLTGPDLSADLLSMLPPLSVNESRWSVSPDASVLLQQQIRGVRLDDPLLVVRRRSGQRTAALLGSGTWRWSNLPEDLQDAAEVWPVVLSNLVQWLTTPEDDRRVRVRPVQDVFGSGERIEFTGQVYDESLRPVPNAAVEVTVTAPDGTRYPYTMESVGEGRYTLDAGRLPEGTYSYVARATRESAELGQDQGRFAVGGASVEYSDTRADVGLMRQLAERSGGRAWYADAAREIGGFLEASESFATTYSERTTETRLWHLYGLLAVALGLLATEWFLRKRSGLV